MKEDAALASSIDGVGLIDVANIDLTSIPSTFRHLVLVGTLQPDTDQRNLWVRLNGDAGANYDWGWDSNQAEGTSLAQAQIAFGTTFERQGNDANFDMGFTIWIYNYKETDFYKSVAIIATPNGDQASPTINSLQIGGRWKNTAAIDQITLLYATGNINLGGFVTLYGVN